MAGANDVVMASRIFLESPEDDTRVFVFHTGPDGILLANKRRVVELVGPSDLVREVALKICTSPGRQKRGS